MYVLKGWTEDIHRQWVEVVGDLEEAWIVCHLEVVSAIDVIGETGIIIVTSHSLPN